MSFHNLLIFKARVTLCAPLFLSKRPFTHAHSFYPIAQIIRQHGEAIGSVIVDVLHREAEAGQLVHGLAVIIVPAAVGTEIIAPDSRGMLLNSSQLRHIGRGFFVRHKSHAYPCSHWHICQWCRGAVKSYAQICLQALAK